MNDDLTLGCFVELNTTADLATILRYWHLKSTVSLIASRYQNIRSCNPDIPSVVREQTTMDALIGQSSLLISAIC